VTDFAGAPNITVYLYANVIKHPAEAQRVTRIEGLDIGCLNGKRHTAKAKTYVLATGGIENVRLLLASGGIGNQHDLVGRFFQGHVTYSMDGDAETEGSSVNIARAEPMTLYAPPGGVAYCVIGSGLAGQARLQAGAFTLTLNKSGPPGPGRPPRPRPKSCVRPPPA
jgi:choline dehydrogenase-like flavoprotein